MKIEAIEKGLEILPFLHFFDGPPKEQLVTEQIQKAVPYAGTRVKSPRGDFLHDSSALNRAGGASASGSFQGNCAARYHAPASFKYGSSSDFTTASITLRWLWPGGCGIVAIYQWFHRTSAHGIRRLPALFLIISASSAD